VLAAVDPIYGARFLIDGGWQGFAILGGVFLAITGGEALYADMGHVGRNPIRMTWYGIVLPALLLNYAGQIALLIAEPGQEGSRSFAWPPDGRSTRWSCWRRRRRSSPARRSLPGRSR
jgi:KUP system potassium uptake protein